MSDTVSKFSVDRTVDNSSRHGSVADGTANYAIDEDQSNRKVETYALPNCPEGWRETTLGFLGGFATSSVDKKVVSSELPVYLVNYMDVYRGRFISGLMPLMAVTATRAEVAKSQVMVGDVLFTPSSETPDDIGHSAVVVDELSRTLHSYHTVRLRLPTLDGVNVRFLGRFANATSTRKHFERSATGSTRYTLSLGDFRSAPVRWPPIEEQRAISDVLDILDTTIRQTEAIIAKLRQVKQGLLHDLLTRGIDANGELRPPQSEAPHLYKQSPLGWIPKNWSTTAIGDIAEIVTGSTPPSSDALAWGQDMPFITPADVLDDRPIRGTERYVSSRGIRYVRRLPPKTTIVVCIGSTIGKVGLTASDACSNQQINAVIPSEDVIADYLYVAIKVNIGQLRGMAGLQAVPIVNKSSFSGMLIPVAPMDEQRLIAERLASVSLRINAEEEVRAKLLEQKSGLMDDLLTGRIRVTPLLEAAATP